MQTFWNEFQPHVAAPLESPKQEVPHDEVEALSSYPHKPYVSDA
jgi:hypothetical protein